MPTATPDSNGPDRYGDDVLAVDWKARGRRTIPKVEAERDLVVELASNGFCGAIGANRVASRTPAHGSGGTGGRKRLSPPVGAA